MDTISTQLYVDLEGVPNRAGTLWTRYRNGRESASFEYSESWRTSPRAFSLQPALHLGPGPFHTARARSMFGAIGDSAPDRWGRRLLDRRERRDAEEGGRTPRSLREIDYLLGVSDVTRLGALRFSTDEGQTFLAAGQAIEVPPFIRLPELLAAATRVVEEEDDAEDLRLLLAPGSSLGGARPKASVELKDGRLAIAKFNRPDDPYDVSRWEAVGLVLSHASGISTAEHWLEDLDGRTVLVTPRFDRHDASRVPFLSAMSLLDAEDGESRSYAEIGDDLRRVSASALQDLEELWRRLLFNVLISNVDDHLRNHGLLFHGKAGWRLSPAYDINPTPTDIKPRVMSTSPGLGDDLTASFGAVLETGRYFGIDEERLREVTGDVVAAAGGWRGHARRLGAPDTEIERMEGAFDHDDATAALEFSSH